MIRRDTYKQSFVRIESLFEKNTSEVTITIKDALMDPEDISRLMEDIQHAHQMTLEFVDARMQFYFRRYTSSNSGHFLEFVASWLHEMDLKTYLEECFSSIKDFILNGDGLRGLLLEDSYLQLQFVDTMFLCPCSLPEKSHDAWLEYGFCLTHLDFGH